MKVVSRFKKFLHEVWMEARPGGRINWPDSRKLMESTVLVLACALFFMLYVGVLDSIFGQIFVQLTQLFR